MNKKKILKYIKVLFLILVLVFLTRYFIRNYEDIKELDISIDPWIFAISMLFYFAYKLSLASLWHYITKLNKCSIEFGKAVSAYLYSILGKYIPGKVFMLAARLPAYVEKNIPVGRVTICFLLENVCTLLGAAFLFLLSLFFFPNDILEGYKLLTCLLVAAFFVLIHPKFINFFLRLYGKVAKKENTEIPVTYPQMLKVVLLFVLNWFIVGTGFYLLTISIYDLPLSNLPYCGGVFGLAAIIGILSIFAPSGIGVREGIMVLGLSLIMPSEYAVIISVVSRLWATVAELILILIAFITVKATKKTSRAG